MAAAPIRPLAWEPPYAAGEAQEIATVTTTTTKKKKDKRQKKKKKNQHIGVPVVVQWLTNPTRNHEVSGSIPGLAQWVKDQAMP